MSITHGKPLHGNAVNAHKFQAVSSLNQLEDYGLLRPTLLLSKKGVAATGVQRADDVAKMRSDIQQTWDKTRKGRADIYSTYIEHVEHDGESGGTPAITVYADRVDASDNVLVIPYSGALVCLDGETQTEARYLLRERLPESGNTPVAVTVYHGISIQGARQILHDYNAYARPIKEGKLGMFSSTGALSQAILDGLAQAEITLEDHINRKGNLPGKKFLASYTQLMHFVTGYALGERTLQSGAAKYFESLNQAGQSAALNHGAPEALCAVLAAARQDEVIRQAPTQVWHCAGVKSRSSKKPVDWHGGMTAYQASMTRKRGGERVPAAERLATIYKAI